MDRNDGALIDTFQAISNRMLGFGGRRDPASAIEINAVPRFSEQTLSEIYRGYKIIQKIVDKLPLSANAREVIIKQGQSNVDTNVILSKWRNIEVNTVRGKKKGVSSAFVEAGILARIFGNAYIILGINDGQTDFSQPVDEGNIQSIEWLAVRDRTRIKPVVSDRTQYQLITDIRNPLPGNNKAITTIHESRILRFCGTELRGYMAENSETAYEDDSIIQSIFNEFASFVTGANSAASMLNSHSIFKYKLNGLARLTQQKNSEELHARFTALLRGLSSIRALVFDAQTEDADFINRNYAGVDKTVIALRDILVAVSGMPHSMLFESPTGGAFSESGASDRYAWADNNATYQRNELLPNHTELLRLTCLAKDSPTKGVFPDDLSIEYPSALQLTRKEIAELKKINAETDKIYHEIGALVPAEIRGRFEGAEYTDEITLIEGVEVKAEISEPVAPALPPSTVNDSEATIEGNKIRVRGQLLPLSEYGEEEEDDADLNL